ncbi:hypothetical protein [Embleya sp. NPDC059237]|uniref:hypothetical protein n=1 Tax=Embleya sp. NPDC059237 TaxID=3346784 RepID=UPI0036D1BC40
MRNPFTVGRRRFVAAAMAAAEASADERAQAIAETWILDADRRTQEAEKRADDLQAALDHSHAREQRTEKDAKARITALGARMAQLRELCRDLARTNAAHGGDCTARMYALERLAHEQAARLAELQRANENTYPPIGIDAETWRMAVEDTRTRIVAEAALARSGGKVA